jgi:hypothetical protein
MKMKKKNCYKAMPTEKTNFIDGIFFSNSAHKFNIIKAVEDKKA